MSYLLDVNVLLAAEVTTHVHHAKVQAWLTGKEIALCPIVQIGFVRLATAPRLGTNLTIQQAQTVLEQFQKRTNARWIADDLDQLDSNPPKSDAVTDHYLADLANKHGLKLATLDKLIKHRAVELIP